MDGKIKRLRANHKTNASESNRKSQAQLSSSRNNGGGHSLDDMLAGDDKRPERLRDLLDDQAPLGAN